MHPIPDRPEFSVALATAGERVVVAVAGEVDLATSDRLGRLVREQLRAAAVVLDLRDVTFMDSSGVRLLDALLRESADQGWDLVLTPDLQPAVRQVLEMTGFLSILPFHDREVR